MTDHECIVGLQLDGEIVTTSQLVTDPLELDDVQDAFAFCPECGKAIDVDWEAVKVTKEGLRQEAIEAAKERRRAIKAGEIQPDFGDLLDEHYRAVCVEQFKDFTPNFKKLFGTKA